MKLILSAFILCFALLPASAVAGPLSQLGLSQALTELNRSDFADRPAIEAFYEQRGHELAWTSSSIFGSNKAEDIVSVLEDSWKHGLNPERYNIVAIKALMEDPKGKNKYQLELILSDAIIKYGRDLTGMRVDPRAIGQRSKYWRQPLLGIDILNHVSKQSDAEDALESLAPKGQLYKSLQKNLVELYKTIENPEADVKVRVTGLLKPGQVNNAVRVIRARMGMSALTAPNGVNYYDDDLAQAVMAFQRSRGVRPDGIIGPQTAKLMNITRDDKINQILVNLERLRWVEPEKPSRYVMVNVPAARLWAVNNGKVALEMPVIVGRKKRPTKIFSTTINGIRFNPTWTVPPTIKKDDYLPKLRADPYYLSDRGIELMNGNMTVDPGTVDWVNASWADVNQMRMVQGSGNRNPLGRVRVLMNNPYNIYLHDTPSKAAFKRDNRALSSGCIRMEDSEALADFVLTTNKGWSTERKKRLLNRGKQIDIIAENPMPVYLLYQTIWLGDQGQLVYGHDLYGHDGVLLNALKKKNAVTFPVDEGLRTALN